MRDDARLTELLTEALGIVTQASTDDAVLTRAPQEDDYEVTHVGTIGRPAFKTVGDGLSLFTAGLGVSNGVGRTEWLNIVSWRAVADWADQNLTKGQRVEVRGKWSRETWTDRDGRERKKQVLVVYHYDAL